MKLIPFDDLPVFGLGLKPFEIESIDPIKCREEEGVIPFKELQYAVDAAIELYSKGEDDIIRAGWNLVHSSENLCLYKRRDKLKPDEPVEYLMTGKIDCL